MNKAQYKWLKIAVDEKLKNELIERENYEMDKGSVLRSEAELQIALHKAIKVAIAREEGLIEGKKKN